MSCIGVQDPVKDLPHHCTVQSEHMGAKITRSLPPRGVCVTAESVTASTQVIRGDRVGVKSLQGIRSSASV